MESRQEPDPTGPQKLARGLQQLGTHGSPMLEAFYHPKEAQKRSYAAVASEAQPIRPAPKKAKRPRPAAVGGPTATCGSQCGCCAPESVIYFSKLFLQRHVWQFAREPDWEGGRSRTPVSRIVQVGSQ